MTSRAIYDGSLSLRFGHLVIGFRTADRVEPTRFSIEETHIPFTVPNDVPPDLELCCRVGVLDAPKSPVTISAGGAWDLHRQADGSEDVIFRGGENFGTDVWHLHLDGSFRTGTLTEAPLLPDRAVRADGYPVLEYIVTRLLGRHDGALIHASTAIVDGEAYVFVGHSGAGKSTMAALAEAAGATIPTDDRTIITVRDGLPAAWGTPWHGSLVRKSPEGAPLRRIYLLQKAPEDRCEPMASGRAIKELFVRLIQPRLDGFEVQRTLEVLEKLVERVPVAVLHFRPTSAAFELALSGCG